MAGCGVHLSWKVHWERNLKVLSLMIMWFSRFILKSDMEFMTLRDSRKFTIQERYHLRTTSVKVTNIYRPCSATITIMSGLPKRTPLNSRRIHCQEIIDLNYISPYHSQHLYGCKFENELRRLLTFLEKLIYNKAIN